MKRLLLSLILMARFLILPYALMAQCGYPITVTTNNNYCVGSTLSLSSTHALASIVWYKDGQPVDSAKALQSLATNGVTVAGGIPLGADNSQVVFCTGICVDGNGNLYVADNIHEWVKKYKPGDTIGVLVAGGNGTGMKANQLHNPTNIALDGQNNLYIYDAANNRIQLWAPGADSGRTIIGVGYSSYSGLGNGLALDCLGNIYVGDPGNYQVLKFPPGGGISGIGEIVAGGHGEGSAANQFYLSGDISVDSKGNIFVVDVYNWRVQKWAPGAAAGITVAGGNGRGSADNQITTVNIWVDGKDTLYVSDPGNGLNFSRVQKWVPGAASGQTLLGGNGIGSAPNQFNGNGPITMDTKGNIYVSDGGNYRVLEFKRSSTIDPTFTPTAAGKYWAVVTDLQGFPATSDTIYMNVPNPGPTNIAITASATSTPVCTPITFTATAENGGGEADLQWIVSGVPTGDHTLTYSNNLFANGDQVYCILTTQIGCTAGLSNDTSNIITLNIDPQGAAAVTISASRPAVCKGDSVGFTATVTNGAAQPTFQWLLNGNPIPGDDSSTYHSDSLSNGDILTCLITSDDVCGLAKSNSLPILVSTAPVITTGEVFIIPTGQTLTLEPTVTGDAIAWLWTPGTGLSDSTIQNPVASPTTTTLYTLKVTAPGGCSDTASILVEVYTPLGIPGAFTPNGDGHNDAFYVLGGPANSRIENFAVFNRWGQTIFQSHNTTPGDASAGWNGYFHGSPAPPDTYVYMVLIKYADGTRHLFKGTVLLIR